jgi:hypothetical protein
MKNGRVYPTTLTYAELVMLIDVLLKLRESLPPPERGRKKTGQPTRNRVDDLLLKLVLLQNRIVTE